MHDLGCSALSDTKLDLAPPETLLTLLSAQTGVAVRVTARVEQPFEDMDFTRQAQFLHAAAQAIASIRTRKLETKGRDVSLLGEPSPRRDQSSAEILF